MSTTGEVQYTGVSIQIQLFPNDLPLLHTSRCTAQTFCRVVLAQPELVRNVMSVSVSSITIPPGTRLEGSKNPPPGQSLCTKALPSGLKRESKAPSPGHKVREFHKHVYEL